MRTENLAIVFVDIAGFTRRTSSQTREENERMLQRYDSVVRPLVSAYEGWVIKTIGDAYLLTFRSPTNALLCAMAIHDRIAETDVDVPVDDRFIVRIAVNVGEVRIDNDDVFGEAVNIASRIENKTKPGEIYFSEAVYLSMIKSEVPCEDLGYAELKGITGAVRLYRIPWTDQSGYALKKPASTSAPVAENADAVVLPYGGHGLDRVRDKLERPDPGQILQPAMEYTQDLFGKVVVASRSAWDLLVEGYEWWSEEVRRSRKLQIILALIIVLFIFWIGWELRPRKLTPWQKFQRSVGF
jgi:adenylate cyclase